MTVPVLPPLDQGQLDGHVVAHRHLATRWSDSTDVAPLIRLLQHRLLIESHAKVEPVERAGSNAGLFARPRSFLTPEHELRMAAAEIAFRYVDTKTAMVINGQLNSPIDAATPQVLNAMLEGTMPTGIISNAGILRATQSKWHPDNNPMEHPRPEDVPELVEAAVDFAIRAPAPAIARAGWLAFTMLCIHPFVDGNGRTARMLFQAVSPAEVPLGVDWGAVEQFSLRREGYIDSLRSGQQVDRYDANCLNPLPFMQFALDCSIDGALLVTSRLEALLAAYERRISVGGTRLQVLVWMAVELWGIATLTELNGLGFASEELAEVVNELVGLGSLAWAEVPASRTALGTKRKHGLIVAA
jgi:Fic/DOC family